MTRTVSPKGTPDYWLERYNRAQAISVLEVSPLEILHKKSGDRFLFENHRWRGPEGFISRHDLASRIGGSATWVIGLEDAADAMEDLVRKMRRRLERKEREMDKARKEALGAVIYEEKVGVALLRFAAEYEPSDEIPEQLADVEGVRLMELVPAGHVYFLIREGTVVYVGQTAAPWPSRVMHHHRSSGKKFDTVWHLPCDPAWLDELEARYIRILRPEYNRAGIR